MKILIQGGGLCGLTTAALLEQAGHNVTIVEKHKQWKDHIGFGISLWKIAMNILDSIGVREAVLEHAYRVPCVQILSKIGQNLCTIQWDGSLPHEEVPHTIERHYLHEILRHRCGNIRTFVGVTSTEISEDPRGVEVTLSNGITERFDLIVGCDGIHSALRERFFERKDPSYYGWKQWLLWVPASVDIPKGVTQIWGQSSFFWVFPSKYRNMVWCAAAAPIDRTDPVEGRVERLQKRFEDIQWLAPEIFKAIEHPEEIFYGDIAAVEMSAWKNGRIILAGDAQHASSPIMGIGASMAMEDGKILVEELQNFSGDWNAALRRYEQRRQERVSRVQKISRGLWNLVGLQNPLLVHARDLALPLIGRSIVKNHFSSVFKSTP